MSTNPGTNTMGISATYYPNQQPGGVLTHSRADRLGATKIPQVSEAHHSKRSHSVSRDEGTRGQEQGPLLRRQRLGPSRWLLFCGWLCAPGAHWDRQAFPWRRTAERSAVLVVAYLDAMYSTWRGGEKSRGQATHALPPLSSPAPPCPPPPNLSTSSSLPRL